MSEDLVPCPVCNVGDFSPVEACPLCEGAGSVDRSIAAEHLLTAEDEPEGALTLDDMTLPGRCSGP